MRDWQSPRTLLLIAVVLTAVAAMALATAYGYSRSSGLFPIFVGWLFLALAAVESLVRLRRLLAARSADAAEPLAPGAGIRELVGFAWVSGMLAAVYLIGFLPATFLFMFAFLRLAAGRGLVRAGLFSVVATLVVYVVFVVLLDYRLYAGIAFGA